MKKSIKKLSLNKITISNLNASEMKQKFGGAMNIYIPTQESMYCWTQACVRFSHKAGCTL